VRKKLLAASLTLCGLVGNAQAASIVAISPESGLTLEPGDPVHIDLFLLVDDAVEVDIWAVQARMSLSAFTNGSFQQVGDTVTPGPTNLGPYPWVLLSTIAADPGDPTSGVVMLHSGISAAPLYVGDSSGVFEVAAAFSPQFLDLGGSTGSGPGGIHLGGVDGVAGPGGGEIIATLIDVNGLGTFCRNAVPALGEGECLLEDAPVPTGVYVTPEPGTTLLIGFGIAGLAMLRRRQH
jgi:hypothetical protein